MSVNITPFQYKVLFQGKKNDTANILFISRFQLAQNIWFNPYLSWGKSITFTKIKTLKPDETDQVKAKGNKDNVILCMQNFSLLWKNLFILFVNHRLFIYIMT